MLLAVAIALALSHPDNLPLAPLMLAAGLALVSFLDDRAHLPVALRLVVHIIAAALFVLTWQIPDPGALNGMSDAAQRGLPSPYATVAAVVAICWMTTLFNFMDGADGMAGGMASIGFGGYAIAATMMPMQDLATAAVAAAVSGAALGFLCFNFPAARVFMGDTGSVPVGFLAATIGIQGSLAGLWQWWFGVLVFSPFIVDASVTLLKRLLRHERIWVAHREHYYQQLILSGWSHRKTVFSYYLLMLGSTESALIAQNSLLLYPIVIFWVITYALLLLYLEWRFYQHKKDKTEDIL